MGTLNNYIRIDGPGVVKGRLSEVMPAAPTATAPILMFNATNSVLTSATLNDAPISGTPCNGLDPKGDMAPPITTVLPSGKNSVIAIGFGDSGWNADVAPFPGPQQTLALYCFWTGYCLTDQNGLARV